MYKPPKHSQIKVTEQKLRKAKAQVDHPSYKRIELKIDPRQNKLMKLDALCHELIHLFDWDLPEGKVRKMATYIAKGLWKEGYRKSVKFDKK